MSGPGVDRPGPDLLSDLFRHPLEPGYAAAARRRSEPGERPRWWSAGGRVARFVALVCAGFLLAVAYQQVVRSEPATSRARSGLAAEVGARRAEADALQRRADRLRDEVARQRDAALADNPDLDRLRELEARTGVGRVRGDGAVVRVADAPAPVDPVTGKASGDNPGRVLDRDLQDIANALWLAGAEAIAVNDLRLTAMSTIRSAGGAILVDFRPITAPYEVSAIGPDGLDERLLDSATGKRFRRYADTYRMQFGVQARKDLVLPAASDPRLRFAGPTAEPAGSPSPSGGGR